MAVIAFSVCCLAWLATAWSVRVQQDQGEEFPWKKAAAIGIALGTQLSGHAALAAPDMDVAHSSDFDDVSVKVVVDRVQTALIALLRENNNLEDETVVEKLMDSLRRSKDIDRDIINSLCSSFLGEQFPRPEVFFVASAKDPGKEIIQQMFFPDGRGQHGVIIARYLKHYREVEHEQSTKDLLRQMELSNSLAVGMVLRCIAQSHTSDEIASELDTEFMIMLEPFSGTLHEIVREGVADFYLRIGLFADAFGVVQLLHDSDVPHKSDITPQTVMVKGIVANRDSLTVVLSPGILDVQPSTTSAIERYNADIQQLGNLLRWLFNANWPAILRPRSELLLAFGMALEGGALAGNHVAMEEMSTVMKLVVDQDTSQGSLCETRMKYLQLAMSVAKPPDTG